MERHLLKKHKLRLKIVYNHVRVRFEDTLACTVICAYQKIGAPALKVL